MFMPSVLEVLQIDIKVSGSEICTLVDEQFHPEERMQT